MIVGLMHLFLKNNLKQYFMIAKIVIYLVFNAFVLLLFMFIRKRMYINSLKKRVTQMRNNGEIDDKTKEGFEILLKYWEDKTKWYNKIF